MVQGARFSQAQECFIKDWQVKWERFSSSGDDSGIRVVLEVVFWKVLIQKLLLDSFHKGIRNGDFSIFSRG